MPAWFHKLRDMTPAQWEGLCKRTECIDHSIWNEKNVRGYKNGMD